MRASLRRGHSTGATGLHVFTVFQHTMYVTLVCTRVQDHSLSKTGNTCWHVSVA